MSGEVEPPRGNHRGCAGLLILALLTSSAGILPAFAYPLDGFGRTGIERLAAGQKRWSEGEATELPSGAGLRVQDVRLHLSEGPNERWDLDSSSPDPDLQEALRSIFAARDSSYAIAIVDLSDSAQLRWAGLREEKVQFPGSVGKLLCMIAVFDGLRRAFPDTTERIRLLRETEVVADEWATGDSAHKVPVVDPVSGAMRYRAVERGDRFSLAEWIDHMISASANSAGAMVWKQAILLHHFGRAYPPGPDAERAFLEGIDRLQLQRLSQIVIDEPLRAAGIELEELQQGTLWTKPAQARVPGLPSFASPRQLVRVLLRIEQGRMVDPWSSLEMKRFLYMTRRRYRYVYAPELHDAAVYFKSGSFYRCEPEEGFECRKYRGNRTNIMNSIAIIEAPAQPGLRQRIYLVALTSNVLKLNSAWDHSRLGAAIDEAVRTRRPPELREEGTEAEIRRSGEGD